MPYLDWRVMSMSGTNLTVHEHCSSLCDTLGEPILQRANHEFKDSSVDLTASSSAPTQGR